MGYIKADKPRGMLVEHENLRTQEFVNHEPQATLKAYLHAAICRADLSAPRNRESNRRV